MQLGVAYARRCRDRKDKKISVLYINVESLNDGVSISVSNLGALYIATGRNLVRLEINSGSVLVYKQDRL